MHRVPNALINLQSRSSLGRLQAQRVLSVRPKSCTTSTSSRVYLHQQRSKIPIVSRLDGDLPIASTSKAPYAPSLPNVRPSALLSSRRHHRPTIGLTFPTLQARPNIQFRSFHASRPNQGHPILFFLIPLLKTSASLTLIKTVARITLSLLPVFIIKQSKIVRWLRRTLPRKDVDEIFQGKRDMAISRLKTLNKIILAMLALPVLLLALTIGASLERTPLTGRSRLIMLSPSEEEEVALELQGEGWYKAIVDVLTQDSPDGKTPPKIVPRNDWRYQWVEQVMRRLEASILTLNDSQQYRDAFESYGTDISTIPPPPDYPLLPRPRASQLLHSLPLSDDHHAPHNPEKPHSHHRSPHTLLGPPYSLLIVENPDRNAFSYGFGPGGSGGIVLYTGFLDEVLSLTCDGKATVEKGSESPPGTSPSWLQSLFGFGTLTKGSRVPSGTPECITAEQTSALATLMAHELSHLVLSHHLETLSSGIFIPIITGIFIDFARVIIFPFTFMFGPFISDALADASKLGLREMTRASESCSSRQLELEADQVSVRLMSLAGFDPRRAIDFWEDRLNDMWALDADAVRHSGATPTGTFWSPHAPAGKDGEHVPGSHPLGSERVRRLRQELDRWDDARRKVRERWAEMEKAGIATTPSQ